ncbi:SLAP domain-containing protein [Companilactobacillus sp. FL22-1]|uniref:SLAP domain-containing protein n=1 Tax=Companilactobacillus sp. FL22-1 TaxID=3373892 RepID=UPI0037545389
MKLIQKSLLLVSMLTVGAGAAVPTVTATITADAATSSVKKIASTKIKVKEAKAQLYNEKGKKLSRCLTKGTTKKTSEKKNIKNCNYYKVGKNEFVKASNVTVEK